MSFAEPEQPPRRAVPLAPMLDVLFLLLIFFVTTSSFRAQEQQLDVNLPAAQAADDAEPQRTEVVINVKKDGSILLDPSEQTIDQLRQTLRQLVEDFPNERVIIRGDKKVTYDRIVQVMDTARAAGVKHVYFATVRKGEQIEG